MKIAQQGNYKATQEKNILLIDIKGPFSELIIKKYKSEWCIVFLQILY